MVGAGSLRGSRCGGRQESPKTATAYERMARVTEYLMLEAREIALARSAAPASISDKAAVMILKPQGYAIAVNGTNGFTCLVEVALRQPGVLESEDEGPVCDDPAASRSIRAYVLQRTQLAPARRSSAQMLEAVRAGPRRDSHGPSRACCP